MASNAIVGTNQIGLKEPYAARQISHELRRCPGSKVLSTLYRLGQNLGSNRLMQIVLKIILKLEGGEFFSYTARQLMQQHHGLDIGAYSYGCFDYNRFSGGALIGRYASIARSVRSYRRNHPAQGLSTHPMFYNEKYGAPEGQLTPSTGLVIEHDVWIGAHAVILPGCQRIGIGAIVGAGAIVTKDVEPYSIVAGNPARKIRARFDAETVKRILRSRWWENSHPTLQSSYRDQENAVFSPASVS